MLDIANSYGGANISQEDAISQNTMATTKGRQTENMYLEASWSHWNTCTLLGKSLTLVHCGKQFDSILKVRYKITIQANAFNLTTISKRKENKSSNKAKCPSTA